MTEAPRKTSGGKIILWIAIGGIALVALCGCLAAIAIPAFIGYIRRAKTADAQANVRAIMMAIRVDHEREIAENGAAARPVPSATMQPGTPPCGEKIIWNNGGDPGWTQLGWSPMDPTFYAYEIRSDPATGTFEIRAYGDLDCDGALSTFVLPGHMDPGGSIVEDPIRITDELE